MRAGEAAKAGQAAGASRTGRTPGQRRFLIGFYTRPRPRSWDGEGERGERGDLEAGGGLGVGDGEEGVEGVAAAGDEAAALEDAQGGAHLEPRPLLIHIHSHLQHPPFLSAIRATGPVTRAGARKRVGLGMRGAGRGRKRASGKRRPAAEALWRRRLGRRPPSTRGSRRRGRSMGLGWLASFAFAHRT